jgi:hypothetical protein
MFALCLMVMLLLVPQTDSESGLSGPKDLKRVQLQTIARLIDAGNLAVARQQLQEEVTRHGENLRDSLSASANPIC